jgi:YD repeat-containing protein
MVLQKDTFSQRRPLSGISIWIESNTALLTQQSFHHFFNGFSVAQPMWDFDVAGHTTTYLYDHFNRVQRAEQPGAVRTEYDYDMAGNLIAVTDPGGVIANDKSP